MGRLERITLPGLLLLGGCHRESPMQEINAEQADALNAIAANTAETAGTDAANGSAAADYGKAYRAGASAPPRHY